MKIGIHDDDDNDDDAEGIVVVEEDDFEDEPDAELPTLSDILC